MAHHTHLLLKVSHTCSTEGLVRGACESTSKGAHAMMGGSLCHGGVVQHWMDYDLVCIQAQSGSTSEHWPCTAFAGTIVVARCGRSSCM